MRNASLAKIAIVAGIMLCALSLVPPADADSVQLEPEETEPGDSESKTVVLEFTPQGDETTGVTLSPDYESEEFGDVTFELTEWYNADGTGQGTGTTFTANEGDTYRAVYTATAETGATEKSYSFTAEAQTDNGNTYSEIMSVDVDTAKPEFGFKGTESMEVEFTPESNSQKSTTANVQIRNTGDGLMDVEDLQLSGVPRGLSATVTQIPDEISAGQTKQGTIEVTAQDDRIGDEYEFSATIEDDLGNTEQFDVEVTVNKIEPEFDINDKTVGEVTFSEASQSSSIKMANITIRNVGFFELPLRRIETSNVPTGVSVSTPDVTREINRLGTETVPMEIVIEDSVSEGNHAFTATAVDKYGNRGQFTVSFSVNKLPDIGVAQSRVDLGQILVDSRQTLDFTVREKAGHDSIQGLTVSKIQTSQGSSISFPGKDSLTVSADEQSSQEVQIDIDSGVPQGKTLSWEVQFKPKGNAASNVTVNYTATVIYPPYYEKVTTSNASIDFDRPRPSVNEFTAQVPVNITNGGDQTMNISEIVTQIDDRNVSASVTDRVSTIGPRSTETATVEIRADTAAIEGTREVNISVTAQEAGQTAVQSQITIIRLATLNLTKNEINFGEVVLTDQISRTMEMSEELGYENVRNFTFQKISGPDRNWLTFIDRPEQLESSETRSLTPTVQFDTSANVFETYRWVYEVDGRNVNNKTITMQAVPRPINFQETIDRLDRYEASSSATPSKIATNMSSTLQSLEAELREGNSSVAQGDIARISSAGQTTIVLIQSAQRAKSLMNQSNYSASQRYLVRASALYNTLSIYKEEVSTPRLKSQLSTTQTLSNQLIDQLLVEQRAYYRQRLSNENTTTLEKAQLQRDLARLSALTGNNSRASTLRAGASDKFRNYSNLVSNANQNLVEAREMRANVNQNLFISVGGQKFFWIGSLSKFNDRRDTIVSNYQMSQRQFDRAGASELAKKSSQERKQIQSEYASAYRNSLAVGGFAAIIFIIIVLLEIRSLYRYRVESEASIRGDFLLPWTETQ